MKWVKEYQSNEMLIQFMKHYLNDNSISLSQPLSEQQAKELFAIARKHDVAHLVGVVAEKLPADQQEVFRPFAKEQMKAMFRYEKNREEFNKISNLFDACQIPYIPLKGAVSRQLYHEPWHRTSCDIDILVPASRLDETVSALQTQLQYEKKGEDRHEVSMWSPNGVHFELHFDIDEIYVTREQFWEDATAESGCYCHRLSNEMLMTAHIAHMAKHFLHGGCGLRPFLDLWFMQEKLTYDHSRLERLLSESGLQTFYVKVNSLLGAWFFDGEADALTRQMEEYILHGGIYGNKQNNIAVTRTMGGNAGQYLLTRLFPPIHSLKYQYPALNRYPWLLPWYWICRAARLIRNGKAWGIGAEYKINRDVSKEDINNTENLLKGLGLKG